MGRPRGSRNQDFDEKRRSLAAAMAERLLTDTGDVATLADLARAAGVSVPTLRHYFADRRGAVAAALEAAHDGGQELLDSLSDPGPLTLEVSLHTWAIRFVDGFRHFGVGALFVGGLSHGLREPVLGPAFVTHTLEPMLAVAERLLACHRDRGELALADDEIRAAALALVSPLAMALIHQDALFGKSCRPLDIRRFAAQHVDRFLAGYAPPS